MSVKKQLALVRLWLLLLVVVHHSKKTKTKQKTKTKNIQNAFYHIYKIFKSWHSSGIRKGIHIISFYTCGVCWKQSNELIVLIQYNNRKRFLKKRRRRIKYIIMLLAYNICLSDSMLHVTFNCCTFNLFFLLFLSQMSKWLICDSWLPILSQQIKTFDLLTVWSVTYNMWNLCHEICITLLNAYLLWASISLHFSSWLSAVLGSHKIGSSLSI